MFLYLARMICSNVHESTIKILWLETNQFINQTPEQLNMYVLDMSRCALLVESIGETQGLAMSGLILISYLLINVMVDGSVPHELR